MLQHIALFVRDDNGAAAVEYGMLVALIAAVIVGSVSQLGLSLKNSFTLISNALTAAGI